MCCGTSGGRRNKKDRGGLPPAAIARGSDAKVHMSVALPLFQVLALGVALVLHQMLGVASVSLTFLTAVLVSAVA